MRRILLLSAAIAAGCITAACEENSPTNPSNTITIPSSPSLDGMVSSVGVVTTTGGLPFTGDTDAFTPTVAFRQFYSFDLSVLPQNAQIESATLRLYQVNVIGTPYLSLGNVVIDHVNYGAALTGAAYDQVAITSNVGVLSSNSTLEYKTLTVTTAVRDDYDVRRGRSQFRLRMSILATDDDFTNDNAAFSDAELIFLGGQPPQLVVSYR